MSFWNMQWWWPEDDDDKYDDAADDDDDDPYNDPQWKCVSLQKGRSGLRSTIMVREGKIFCHFTSWWWWWWWWWWGRNWSFVVSHSDDEEEQDVNEEEVYAPFSPWHRLMILQPLLQIFCVLQTRLLRVGTSRQRWVRYSLVVVNWIKLLLEGS